MSSIAEFAEALDEGDYKKALAAYRTTEHAGTPIGKPTEAFLMALTGDHDGAARQLTGVTDAGLIAAIVKGERDRTARWTDASAAASLEAAAADKAKIPPVAGKMTFRDGSVREFKSIVDSDDGIGAMLETYGPDGLLYMPFASLRSVTFLPPRNFVDNIVPRAEVVLADGSTTTALVPLLYALSSTSRDETIRAGRMTTWKYVGAARRGSGQRDFVLDGGRMIAMQNVAAIELHGASAARSTSPRAPLPRATAQATSSSVSSKNMVILALVLAAIVVVVFLMAS